jgi:hypothetical protein
LEDRHEAGTVERQLVLRAQEGDPEAFDRLTELGRPAMAPLDPGCRSQAGRGQLRGLRRDFAAHQDELQAIVDSIQIEQ